MSERMTPLERAMKRAEVKPRAIKEPVFIRSPDKYQVDGSFGDWTVIGPTGYFDGECKNTQRRALCRCVCKTERRVLAYSLLSETSSGCGCKNGNWFRAANFAAQGKVV